MDFGLESQKKDLWVVEDDCEVVMMGVPKALEVADKDGAVEFRVRLPNVGEAMRNALKCREVGEFISGALAGAMTKAVLAPLETIRTRMVVGVGSKHIAGSFVEVVEQQGWRGLWAGNTINMLRIIPTQAIEFGTFEFVKREMTSAQEKCKENGCPKLRIGHINIDLSFPWISPVAVGGAAAGIVSTLVCHPLEVIKDRLTVNRDLYPSISLAFRKIYKEDGISGFYAGISPTLIGMLPYSTCYYFMYETIKKTYCQAKNKKSLNRAELLIVGALSGSNLLLRVFFVIGVYRSPVFLIIGLTASTISFPLEVARKRLMVGALRGKCPNHMAGALAEVLREDGLLGLYRGWGASCLKVMPTSGITWMFYEAWKEVLLGDKPHL